MNQQLRTTSAASLIVLASMIAGCAAPHARVGAAQFGGKADVNVGLATRALAALNSNNVPMAIDLAEKAVAKTPNDAGFRALLGNAYFAGGRFQSAQAAFRDSLSLVPTQPQVLLKLALAEIASGNRAQAIADLRAGREMLDASDYGLALALAGHTSEAVAVLDPAAREKDADATVRQNLALAHALAGDWDEARVIASQDVPAAQLDARMQQWMQLASPKRPADQVAALVGVTPAVMDPGQPVQLALYKEEARPVQVAAVAAPAPAPAPAKVAQAPQPKPSFTEAAAPTVAAMPAPVVAVAPAPPPPRTTLATIAASMAGEAQAVLSAVLPHRAEPKPVTVALPKRAPQPMFRRGNSPVVVQLAAYQSPDRVLAAWNGAAKKYGALRAYMPTSARFASAKGTFYRLSVRGFSSLTEANALCNSLRRQGGSCFVRNVAGDTPVQYASR